MALTRDTIQFALRNVARYGDTDVFPFPIENHVFFDAEAKILDLLEDLHRNFDQWLTDYPPVYVKSLSTVGYNGFRAATQIDPIWNAYLLALIIALGPDIEQARVSLNRNAVFSYRFNPDPVEYSLFQPDINWRRFHEISVERAKQSEFVLTCDISDFYSRIYHHRLENALKKASKDTETIRRVMELLTRLSDNASYGLPIGGSAARLLSELLINRVDRLLLSEGMSFCRFVDDFHIFTSSREQAYSHLVFLSQALLTNEGLSLQRTKTRIMSREEFLASSRFADEGTTDSEHEQQAKDFLKLRLHYDPYSPTAADDYEALRDEIERFDVVGMLAREMRKSRIDEALTRQLVRSIKYLDSRVRDDAVRSLMDNLPTLYPVFPSVMILLRSLISDIGSGARDAVFQKLRGLVSGGSYMTRVPANLAFALRVLAYDESDETEVVLNDLYKQPLDMMLKRDLILIMARRNADYWISNCRKQYPVLTRWERRALIVGSYILEDEGAHWRKAIKSELSPVDRVIMEWAASRKSSGTWSVPL